VSKKDAEEDHHEGSAALMGKDGQEDEDDNERSNKNMYIDPVSNKPKVKS